MRHNRARIPLLDSGRNQAADDVRRARADTQELTLRSFLRAATSIAIRRRQIIYYEGRPIGGVYLVESGRIRCLVTTSDGREFLLGECLSGEFFGLIETLRGTPALATSVAAEHSVLRFMDRDSFRRLLARDTGLAVAVSRGLADRLRVAYRRSAELAYESLDRRILSVLNELAAVCGIRRGDETLIDRTLSINELANMVAASRPRVSLAVQNLIQCRRLSRIDRKFILPN